MTEAQLKDYERSHVHDVKPTLGPNDREYWNAPHTQHFEYPLAMHRGIVGPEGNVILETEICESDEYLDLFTQRGFHKGSQQAFDAYEKQQQMYAEAAANKAYGDAKMSAKAQAEAAAQDAATEGHVTDPKEAERLKRAKKAE